MRRAITIGTSIVFAAGLVFLGVALDTHYAKAAPACMSTGFYRDGNNLTAALINPASTVSSEVDATGCNIAIYFGPGNSGAVNGANIHGANYFGVVNNGGNVSIQYSRIHDIGEQPLNGDQHGVGIYFAYGSSATGFITGNTLWNYQKGGIVVNGPGSVATISDNTVTGQGPVNWIAQNGIQIGYGASATVMRNTVTGNSYTGTSTVSGGIIVVGGPEYDAAYTIGTQIVGNTVTGNDIGIWLTNIDQFGNPPSTATNVKVVNNSISNNAVSNNYGGFGYQPALPTRGTTTRSSTTPSPALATPQPPPAHI